MDGVLALKLATPRPSQRAISRPRLRQLLDDALQARLVLLSAPPGFGKTTALVDWLDGRSVRSSWISLDTTDNDPVRFLRCLGSGVAKLAGGDASAIGPAEPGVNLVDAVAGLSGLLADVGEQSVLVLDDYHVIASPAIHRAVAFLLERLPPLVHVLIATRADPPLPLARLRARGDLVELRADALRFTTDEACRFFADRMGLDLSDGDLQTLVSRTEGWPAVLQLAGLSLAGRSDVPGHVRAFAATHRFVLDYVLEEVLAGLAPPTQDFLLRTSILERLSAPLCEAVTGESDCQARLEDLERANLLIVPLDDERCWYRYHALFAEILRARMAALHGEELVELHARASAWYEVQGDDEQAIGHAIRSGDFERTSEILADASLRHLNAGELSTVRRWLDALPPEIVRDHAQLSASYAWCLTLAGETEGVVERLADAERAPDAGRAAGPIGAAIPTELALLRSRLASLEGDGATAIEQARLARQLLPEGLDPLAEATLRGDAAVLLAVGLLREGDTEGAAQAYAESLPDLRAGGNRFAVGRAIADLASIALGRGHPAAAVALCESELERDRQASTAGSPAVWAILARARVEIGLAEPAAAAARRALDLAARAGDTQIVRSAEATLERLAHAELAARVPAANAPGGLDRLVEALSARELEVLRLVALGRSNSQIAAELFVTVGTVKSHLHTISGKLGAANRVEAAARGRDLGLIS